MPEAEERRKRGQRKIYEVREAVCIEFYKWFDSEFGHGVTTLDQVRKKQQELDQKQSEHLLFKILAKYKSTTEGQLCFVSKVAPTTFCESIMLILKRR